MSKSCSDTYPKAAVKSHIHLVLGIEGATKHTRSAVLGSNRCHKEGKGDALNFCLGHRSALSCGGDMQKHTIGHIVL